MQLCADKKKMCQGKFLPCDASPQTTLSISCKRSPASTILKPYLPFFFSFSFYLVIQKQATKYKCDISLCWCFLSAKGNSGLFSFLLSSPKHFFQLLQLKYCPQLFKDFYWLFRSTSSVLLVCTHKATPSTSYFLNLQEIINEDDKISSLKDYTFLVKL